MKRHRPAAAFALPLALAGLIALAPRADAVVRCVSPTGNDLNTGSASSPWATIRKANQTLVAGDVCMIEPGTYADAVNPAHSGVWDARITYLGNLSRPGDVVVPAVTLSGSWVTVKGISSTASGELSYASETALAGHDSIAWCNLGGIGIAGAKYAMIARNSVHGVVQLALDHYHALSPATSNCDQDTLRGNVIDVGAIPWKAFVVWGYTQHCVIDSNRVSARFAGTSSDIYGRYVYNSYDNVFRDNRWTFEADNASPNTGNPWWAFALRDSSSRNVFERDTMVCGLQSGYSIGGRLVNAGNAAWVGQSRGNRWSACVFLVTGYVWCQDKFNDSVVEDCVFASPTQRVFYIADDMTNCTIRHNTFWTGNSTVVWMEGSPAGGGDVFTSNVLVGSSGGVCGHNLVMWPSASGIVSDYNVYGSLLGTPSDAIKAGSACSAPGPGTAWNLATGNDAHSKFGVPSIVNATFGPTFDGHPVAGSIVLGTGEGGSTTGALDQAGPDPVPPATIQDLGVGWSSDHAVGLGWTAPGDNGTSGTAAAYDLRWSVAPINDANFAAATPASAPPPVSGGSTQFASLGGLSPGTRYYVAVRTRDAAGNWSLVSSALSATTTSNDTEPPAAVRDLHVTAP
jgi:hypothetical protein